MNEKRTIARPPKSHVPYDPESKAATLKYWKDATAHRGVAELARNADGQPSQGRNARNRLHCAWTGRDGVVPRPRRRLADPYEYGAEGISGCGELIAGANHVCSFLHDGRLTNSSKWLGVWW